MYTYVHVAKDRGGYSAQYMYMVISLKGKIKAKLRQSYFSIGLKTVCP